MTILVWFAVACTVVCYARAAVVLARQAGPVRQHKGPFAASRE